MLLWHRVRLRNNRSKFDSQQGVRENMAMLLVQSDLVHIDCVFNSDLNTLDNKNIQKAGLPEGLFSFQKTNNLDKFWRV
jgi:hypothetical protein